MAQRRKSRKQVVKDEMEYLKREVEPAVLRGDCYRLQEPNDGKFLCMGGPISATENYLHLRTNKGPITLLMTNEDLATLQEQCLDLCMWVEQEAHEREKEQELQRAMIQPPSSIEVH